jgi:hypothetical protein
MITRSNDLKQALTRIVQENSAYYEIELIRPGVGALHRAGYLTPRASTRARQ